MVASKSEVASAAGGEPSLDELRQSLYWPLTGEDAGGYALWRQFDPDLALQLSAFFVGGLYQREVLTKRERQLCTVAALTAMRCPSELRAHVHAARNLGITKAEIAEVVFQMLTYAGAPAVVQGLKIVKAALEERGEWEAADGPSA